MSVPTAAVRAISIAGLIAFWAALAALNGDPQVLPGPGAVLPKIVDAGHNDLYDDADFKRAMREALSLIELGDHIGGQSAF